MIINFCVIILAYLWKVSQILIKGIIFDLGGTLIKFNGDWAAIAREGAEAMTTWYLKKRHIKLDATALIETFVAERMANEKLAEQTHAEILAQQTLRTTLKKIAAPPAAIPLTEAALKVYFEPEEAAYTAFPDAVDTLKRLKGQGYRLGLYSNATDDPLVQRLVNRNSLRPRLSPTFSSAGCGWRKPKREAFEMIARRWGLSAQEIVVVGDKLAADILGAHNAGMHSILATMQESPSNEQHRHIQPSATIANLAQLPQLLSRL
jgi:HAD superfamily hydrolase (TIGR01662 family)